MGSLSCSRAQVPLGYCNTTHVHCCGSVEFKSPEDLGLNLREEKKNLTKNRGISVNIPEEKRKLIFEPLDLDNVLIITGLFIFS